MTVDTDVTASASVLDCKSSPPPWRLFGSVFSRISRTRSARSSSGRHRHHSAALLPQVPSDHLDLPAHPLLEVDRRRCRRYIVLLPSVITVRGTRPSYEADAYRFAEPGLRELTASGRIDPAKVAVMTGQAPRVYGSEPAPASRAETEFVEKAMDAHLALCYADPGRAEAVERDWQRSVDRIEARASGGDAPEDARNYVEALCTEQNAQLPGWELARFVSRAHTAVGLPVVQLEPSGDKVVPAFSPATIERLGESYPDLHAAVRTMDPASPLAHPGPKDDPRYAAELNRALDGLRSSRGGGPGAVVDPVEALAVAAVVQERSLAAPARDVSAPSLPGRPWEGPGSPGFDRRLQENVTALVAAVDAAGVPVTFSDRVREPVVEYPAEPACSGVPAPVALGGAEISAPPAKLVLPASYAAPAALEASAVSSDGRGVSVADLASDGLPVLATDRLSPDELRTVFEAVALALPAALRDQPYPEELAKSREVVYSYAGEDAGRLLRAGGGALRRPSRGSCLRVCGLPAEGGVDATGGACVAGCCRRRPLRQDGGGWRTGVAADGGRVASDASRAVAVREAACERLQDVVVPALRDVGVPVRIDPQATVSQYVPDPRPAHAQSGPAQDAVVISGNAVRTDVSTRVLVEKQAEALAAVGLAVGQRGRADRPEARKVASELAGRTRCPAEARVREGAACAHFANRQLADLWPPRTALPATPRAPAPVKVAAGEARAWVASAVAARETRMDAEFATPPDRPGSGSGPAPVAIRTVAPVPVRPAPVPAPAPPAPGRAVAR